MSARSRKGATSRLMVLAATAIALAAAPVRPVSPARSQDPNPWPSSVVKPGPSPSSQEPGKARPDAPEARTPAQAEAKPNPPAPPVLDCTSPFDLAAYEAALGRIAAAYPDLLRVRSLGKSRGGKDVWLAVAADDAGGAGGDVGRRPAAIVITDLAPIAILRPATDPASAAPVADGPGVAEPDARPLRIAGPEAALFALVSLLERAHADAAVRERLQRCALYFLPAPDPDLAFPAVEMNSAAGPRRARIDRNFPSGWEPFDADSRASGPYPLCEPESQVLARFLLERVNLSVVVTLKAQGDRGLGERKPDANLGTELAPEPVQVPGSLEVFCREALDVVLRCPVPWKGATRTSSVGTAPEGFFTAATLVERILDEMPRLECGSPKIEQLRPDVWLVDLPLSNVGSLPTLGRGGRGSGARAIQMRASGGRVVACAVRRVDATTYDAVRGARGAWPLGSLDGNATVGVRLVVQAEEGASLEAVFDSPRAGRARASVGLH